jgi:hypothetical protein
MGRGWPAFAPEPRLLSNHALALLAICRTALALGMPSLRHDRRSRRGGRSILRSEARDVWQSTMLRALASLRCGRPVALPRWSSVWSSGGRRGGLAERRLRRPSDYGLTFAPLASRWCEVVVSGTRSLRVAEGAEAGASMQDPVRVRALAGGRR